MGVDNHTLQEYEPVDESQMPYLVDLRAIKAYADSKGIAIVSLSDGEKQQFMIPNPNYHEGNQSKNHEAVLSSANGFTIFSFGGRTICFRAPYSLERYVDVVKWDNGYLVVMAKYSHDDKPEEEFIDLKPILDDLYIDATAFLEPIKSVRIAYE